MQAVRFNSDWGYHSRGDVTVLPMREVVHLVDRGLASPVANAEFAPTRYNASKFTTRSLDMAPKSLDTKERTIELIAATVVPVARQDWTSGEYLEVLDCSAGAVRLGRMNGGCPLLDSHKRDGVERILGAVVPNSARAIGKAVVAKVKFSRSEDGERAFQDAKDGVLRAISVGYTIYGRKIDNSTTPPTHTVVDWEPVEISAVAVPADSASGFL